MSEALLTPCRLGDIELRNRIVMAPLTRCRADNPESAPTALMATYYAQRAAAGLIVSEGTIVSPRARGYRNSPGIWSTAQVDGWRQVTDAVHAAGGRIVLQLWHVGRISHTSLLPGGAQPVSSTNQRPNAMTYTANGFEAVSEPRALGDDEIPALLEDYRNAARNARAAGFDGVEIHGANT